jgi:pyruvate,water dikinase
MNLFRRFAWRQLLRLGSGLIGLRERGRDTQELQNATYGLAARLLSRHYFPDQPPDHLWLYTFEELLTFGRSHGQERVPPEEVASRRAELERNHLKAPPPELIWYEPATRQWWPVLEPAPEDLDTSRVRLQGIGASAGSGPVEGIALVTSSAQEAAERLLKVDGSVVLVTHVTDPVWSSLFTRVTAVVTEMGGIISHAAIVARENGIPAVVGVPNATQLIRDGQWVRVDGAAGLAEVVGEGRTADHGAPAVADDAAAAVRLCQRPGQLGPDGRQYSVDGGGGEGRRD